MAKLLAGPEVALACLVTVLSLFAVVVPLLRGARLCLRARAATRRLRPAELRGERAAGSAAGPEPIAALMLRVVRESLRDPTPGALPPEFVLDASRQYATNEYDAHYTRPISMYANLLPPIGFIGTTGGLLVLFVSMHLASRSLELGALAVALTSSIFALLGFALLEAWKIRLYGRLLGCLDEVVALQRAAQARREPHPADGGRAPSPARARG